MASRDVKTGFVRNDLQIHRVVMLGQDSKNCTGPIKYLNVCFTNGLIHETASVFIDKSKAVISTAHDCYFRFFAIISAISEIEISDSDFS